ncbi:MAG: hypothetical protein ACRD1N_07920 [Terriglobia bacterium]
MLISLTAALPNIYQEGQREREQEAIFRGEQYARAIYLFHRRLGRYPASLKEILNTNGVHYLRKAYRDPLSPNGRWRFIHAAANGMLIDSWTQQVITPSAQSGPGILTNPNAFPLAQNAGAMNSGMQPGGMGNAEAAQGGAAKPKHPPSSCAKSGDSNSPEGTLLGAFIAGVAPCSERQSIRVFNHKDHYDEWEFLGAKYTPYALPKSNALSSGSQGGLSQPGTTGLPGQTGFPGQPQNFPGSNQ